MSNIPENAPDHCPGTESQDAGKASACAGCPNQNICSSGAAQQPDPDENAILERLAGIRRKVVVLSGKGGVGKSTLTAMLARTLANENENTEVGVLDVDICGPSQPRLLGVADESVHASGTGWSPVYATDNLCVMSIAFLLNSAEDAVIWRGPKKNGLIKQFLKDVDWGSLDYLIVDTPPGTSDEHLSLAKFLGASPNTAAVVITTPQEVALLDVRKEMTFCERVKLPIAGVVENMSAFVCPKCKTESTIFPATSGGAAALAMEFGATMLGRVPLEADVARACDAGDDVAMSHPHSAAVAAYKHIAEGIKTYFDKKENEELLEKMET